MKKSIIVAGAIFLWAGQAFAFGQLESQKVEGFFRYCYYTDGGALTVGPSNQCPMDNRGVAGIVDLQSTSDTGKLASEEIKGKFKFCHYYGGASVPVLPNETCPKNSQ